MIVIVAAKWVYCKRRKKLSSILYYVYLSKFF